MFQFDLQRFNFGPTVTTTAPQAAQVTELSPEQRRNIELSNMYLEQISPVLGDLVSKGSSALQAYQAPNFDQYYDYGMGTTLAAANMTRQLAQKSTTNPYDAQYQQLASGQLPSAYKANMDATISEALAPYQNQFQDLASRGVINSSLGRNWATDMSKAAQTAANLAYGQNISTAANVLGGAAQNRFQNLSTASQLANQYGQSATAPLAFQNTYYQTATQPAKDFLTLGTATYQPIGNAAQTAYQWQAGLSAPAQGAQTVVSPSPWGSVFGGVAGAATGGLFCFPAGTKIATPTGERNIEDVAVGDTVSTLCGDQEVTKTIQSVQPIVRVRTTQGELLCTETEILLSVEGSVPAGELMSDDVLIHKNGGAVVLGVDYDINVVPVYEIVAPWFYANGFVVDGFDPEVK